MSGLRLINSWATSPFLRSSVVRVLGASQLPLTKPSFVHELETSNGRNSHMRLGIRKLHFVHKDVPAGSGTSRKYWSAIAAGLLGLGGTVAIFKSVANFKESLLLPVHCADNCNNDCVPKKCDQSDCLRKMDRDEEMISKGNAELEKAIRDTKGRAVEFTEAALKAYCDATEAIDVFMKKTYCAVEDDVLESPRFDEVWCDVYEALKKRCELANEAMAKSKCASELLTRLRGIIDNGRACKYTSCNPILATAEETLNCAERELCLKKAAFDELLKVSRTAEQYRNMVEEFRRDMKTELDSLIPGEDCKVNLSYNEASMILTHAYRKLLRVQKETKNDDRKC